MFKKFRGMLGLDKPKMMKDPAEQRKTAAEAARKKREDEESSVRVVRPSEIHRRESKNVGRKKNMERRGTPTSSKSHDVSHLGKATSKELEAAMRQIEQSAGDDKAA